MTDTSEDSKKEDRATYHVDASDLAERISRYDTFYWLFMTAPLFTGIIYFCYHWPIDLVSLSFSEAAFWYALVIAELCLLLVITLERKIAKEWCDGMIFFYFEGNSLICVNCPVSNGFWRRSKMSLVIPLRDKEVKVCHAPDVWIKTGKIKITIPIMLEDLETFRKELRARANPSVSKFSGDVK